MFTNFFTDIRTIVGNFFLESSQTQHIEDEDINNIGDRYVRCIKNPSSGFSKIFNRTLYGEWIEEATLFPTADTPTSSYGTKCCISGDGLTAVVSDPDYDSNHGALFVFTRTGSVWTYDTRLDTATAAFWQMGKSMLDISDDGSVIAVSYSTDTAIFRNTGTWAYEDRFGSDDGCLSGDGDTVCCRLDSTTDGFEFYTYSGTWSLSSSETGVDWYQTEGTGIHPSLNDDGTIMAWIPPGAGSGTVFEKTGGTWGVKATFTIAYIASLEYMRIKLTSDGLKFVAFAASTLANSDTITIFSWNGSGWDEDQEITFNTLDTLDSLGVVSGDGDHIAVRSDFYSNTSES